MDYDINVSASLPRIDLHRMITLIDNTTFTWECESCGASASPLYSAVTLGIADDGDAVNARAMRLTCAACGATNTHWLPPCVMDVAALCLYEIFQKAMTASCTIHADYVAADITALLTGKQRLTTWETLPFDPTGKSGHIHFDAALGTVTAANLLELLQEGNKFYGTDSEVEDYIGKITSDSSLRAIFLKRHGINTP